MPRHESLGTLAIWCSRIADIIQKFVLRHADGYCAFKVDSEVSHGGAEQHVSCEQQQASPLTVQTRTDRTCQQPRLCGAVFLQLAFAISP
jgi:hypothetical protein